MPSIPQGRRLCNHYLTQGKGKHLISNYYREIAMLEVSVHVDLSEDLPMDRYYVEIDIPDDITILELKNEDLPDGWDSKPPILETQYIGDDFVKEKSAAVLKVPSCIVQQEFN
jgi:hypothetical protein